MQIEYFFDCPYCGERISMMLDLTVPEQSYVEDCEICCRPIEIGYGVEGEEIAHFEARRME